MNRRTILVSLTIAVVIALTAGLALAGRSSSGVPRQADSWAGMQDMHWSEQMREMHEQMPGELQAQCDALHEQMGPMNGQMTAMHGGSGMMGGLGTGVMGGSGMMGGSGSGVMGGSGMMGGSGSGMMGEP